MRHVLAAVLVMGLSDGAATIAAIDLDVTSEDVDWALTIARGSEAERAAFHAPYLVRLNEGPVETAEVISEFRRVVLLAEQRIQAGERLFSYSVTRAMEAARPWVRRVSVKARLRFHPHNTYVNLPSIDVSLDGNARARVGVLSEPVRALATGRSGERIAIAGAIVEGVFDAALVGEGLQTFIFRLDQREVARVSFDLSTLR